MAETTTAWTLDELRELNATLESMRYKIVELDADETRSQELGKLRGDTKNARYAVCSANVVRARKARRSYVTDCNTAYLKGRKGDKTRVENFHEVHAVAPTLATALWSALSRGYAGPGSTLSRLVMDRMHTDALRENARRDGCHVDPVAPAPQPWVAALVSRDPVDRSGKGKGKRKAAKPRKPATKPAEKPVEKVATVTPIRPDRPASARLTKAERKAANRTLAAELRTLGFVPNGDVWVRAKQLRAAGREITRESMRLEVDAG